MALDVLLITNDWCNKCDDQTLNIFDKFCAAYSRGRRFKKVGFDELATQMNDAQASNPKTEKLFDYIYTFDNATSSKYVNLGCFVTGFCDITSFIVDVKTKDDTVFLNMVLNLFLDKGGMIRYQNKDYVIGDFTTLWSVLKPNLP